MVNVKMSQKEEGWEEAKLKHRYLICLHALIFSDRTEQMSMADTVTRSSEVEVSRSLSILRWRRYSLKWLLVSLEQV